MALASHGLAKYCIELVVVGTTYFALTYLGSTLAAFHPGASPIWPSAGFAIAAVILRGLHVWPAIFSAALVAGIATDVEDATLVGSILTSSAIAAGNTLEALIAGHLTNIWSDGRRTFDTPIGIAKFALISLGPGTVVGALIGAGTLAVAGASDLSNFTATWVTWWLRDVIGALVVAPVVLLWANSDFRTVDQTKVLLSGIAIIAAIAVGLFAFSPLFEQTVTRSSLGFLAVLPLLWAALQCSPRDTATIAAILSGFAVWGAMEGGGPFSGAAPGEYFLLLIMFMIITSVLSLALSADVAVRNQAEAKLRQREQNFHGMFGQSAVGIAQTDTTGRFTLVNNRFCEMLDRSAAKLLE